MSTLPGLFKIRASYKPTAEVNTFVGEQGQLFYSEQDKKLRISDGETPGGIIINSDAIATSSVNTEVISLSGTEYTLLFDDYNINDLLNYLVFDDNNQLVEVVSTIEQDRLILQSNINLLNHFIKIVYQ